MCLRKSGTGIPGGYSLMLIQNAFNSGKAIITISYVSYDKQRNQLL